MHKGAKNKRGIVFFSILLLVASLTSDRYVFLCGKTIPLWRTYH